MKRAHPRTGLGRLELLLDQRLQIRVIHGTAALQGGEVVDQLLRAHHFDQRQQDGRRHLLHHRGRHAVRDMMLDDRLSLLDRSLGPRQFLERGQAAVGRRILIEQDLLRPLTWLDVQQSVEPLDRLAGHQYAAVEPIGVSLALAQVARDFRLRAPRRIAEQAELLHHCLH